MVAVLYGRTNRSLYQNSMSNYRHVVMMFLMFVFYAILSVTEGCSSRSAPRLRPLGPTARPNITFHTYACPPIYANMYCLNGATCFTVKIGEHLLYNCECAEGFIGSRCELKDVDSSYLLSHKNILQTASIAFGALLAVILVVFVCIFFYFRYGKRKQNVFINLD